MAVISDYCPAVLKASVALKRISPDVVIRQFKVVPDEIRNIRSVQAQTIGIKVNAGAVFICGSVKITVSTDEIDGKPINNEEVRAILESVVLK